MTTGGILNITLSNYISDTFSRRSLYIRIMTETEYLFSTTENSDWLKESFAQADRGELHELLIPIMLERTDDEK